VIVDSKRKGILKKDSCFGELALLSDSTRKASIKTLEKSSFWVLTRERFLTTIKRIMMRNIDSLRKHISSVPFFSHLNDGAKEALASSAIIRKYFDGDLVIREGEKGDFLFVLLAGVIKFIRQGQEIARIKDQGEVFGENALLTGSVRTASCFSYGPSEVMMIEKSSLETVFGMNFKETLLRCISKLSIQSNPHLTFLNKTQISAIIEHLHFFEYPDKEIVVKDGVVNECLGVVCVGGLFTEGNKSRKVCAYQVIGFFDELEATFEGKSYLADGVTIIARIDYRTIESIVGVSFQGLANYLETLKFLKNVSLFKNFSLDSLKKVSEAVKVLKLKKDSVIFMASDKSESIFIVKEGLVNIVKGDKLLRLLSQKECFGERCLVEKKRSASAVCYEDSELYEVSKDILLSLPEKRFLKIEIDRKKNYQNQVNLQDLHVKFRYPYVNGSRSYFNVRNLETDAVYDLMLIPKSSLSKVSECDDLVREKQLQILLDHHLIQKLVTAGRHDAYIMFVTEHIPGNFLKKFLPTTEDYAKVLVVYICSILEYLHDKHIIYRDLDSSNILISSKGFPYLFNFKNSKIVQDRTYTKAGNYFYMAQEMILGRGYSKSVDFWSLGVLIHEMLYGILPFDLKNDDNASTAFNKILNNELLFKDKKFESANQVIRSLLSPASTRFDSEKIKKSSWMGNIEYESLLMLNVSSSEFPNINFPQIKKSKVELHLFRLLEVMFK
jgi:CRP-like cAMP-binding protein